MGGRETRDGAGHAVFCARGLCFRAFLPLTDSVVCSEEVGGTVHEARAFDSKWEGRKPRTGPGTQFSVLVAFAFVRFCRQRTALGVGRRLATRGLCSVPGI